MLQPLHDWIGIYVATLQRPYPPRELKLAAGAEVRLEWQPGKYANETKAFHIYRGNEKAENFAELAVQPASDDAGKIILSYTDGTAQTGTTYTYAVSAEEWSSLESGETSNTLKVTVATTGNTAASGASLKDWDKIPPPAVTSFTVSKEPDADGQYRLKWERNPAKDMRYYNVYFSSQGKPEISQKRLIVSPLPGMTEYLDWSAPLQGDGHYAITAVDRQGNESAPVYASTTK